MLDDRTPPEERATDPNWPALERALAPLAPPPPPDWSRVSGPSHTQWLTPERTWLLVAACAAVVAGALWWNQTDAWSVRALAGDPRVRSALPWQRGLHDGGRLETGPEDRARIRIGEIGIVELEPESRLRRLHAPGDVHRLALENGRMRAVILAPPRQFVVETPSAVATDLGCAYTLQVDDAGRGLLVVEAGWVAFERAGRETFIPAGARCRTQPGTGPRTPYYADAPTAWVEALELYEDPGASPGVRESALTQLLDSARARDAFSLWHLISRVPAADRGRVVDRLARLVPPPAQAPRAEVIALDRAALDAWWNVLGVGDASWWRIWEDSPPE